MMARAPSSTGLALASLAVVGWLAACSSSSSSAKSPSEGRSDGGSSSGGSSGSGSSGGGPSGSGGVDGGSSSGSAMGVGDSAGTVTLPGGGNYAASGPPDFGPNVLIFDPSMGDSAIQSKIDAIFGTQQTNQFGSN